jgi:hypothetical protein
MGASEPQGGQHSCPTGASCAPLTPSLLDPCQYNTAQVRANPPSLLFIALDTRVAMLTQRESRAVQPRPVRWENGKAARRVSGSSGRRVGGVEGVPVTSVCVSQQRSRLSTFSCDHSLLL